MGFLAPAFLLGALAVGLPIYLHLLRRSTSTPRPFSSLMLFEARQQSATQRRRLRYWLLLAHQVQGPEADIQLAPPSLVKSLPPIHQRRTVSLCERYTHIRRSERSEK